MTSEIIDFLRTRRSSAISSLTTPGPNDEQLTTMLGIAARVPDHGRLEPWRFILYRGDARIEAGKKIAARAQELEGPLPEGRLEKELERFSRAPLVVGVVFSPVKHERIPEWEQFLSAGAVAMNLCLAANALGFGANWITNWYSDDSVARGLLGIAEHERVAGFIHIGTTKAALADRPRPDLGAIVSEYK